MKMDPFVFINVYPCRLYWENGGLTRSPGWSNLLSECHKESIFLFPYNSCRAFVCAPNHKTVCPFINGQKFGVPFCSFDLCYFLLTRPNCLKIFPFCCHCLKLLNVSGGIPHPLFFLTLYSPVYHSTCYCSEPWNHKCYAALSERWDFIKYKQSISWLWDGV